MVRHRIDSVNDCARRRYNLRITCASKTCGHVVEANTTLMMQHMGPARAKWPLERLEGKLKCSRCGQRGAAVSPCEVGF